MSTGSESVGVEGGSGGDDNDEDGVGSGAGCTTRAGGGGGGASFETAIKPAWKKTLGPEPTIAQQQHQPVRPNPSFELRHSRALGRMVQTKRP